MRNGRRRRFTSPSSSTYAATGTNAIASRNGSTRHSAIAALVRGAIPGPVSTCAASCSLRSRAKCCRVAQASSAASSMIARQAPRNRRQIQRHRPRLARHERPDADRRAQHADDPAGLHPPPILRQRKSPVALGRDRASCSRRPPTPPMQIEQHARQAQSAAAKQRNVAIIDDHISHRLPLRPSASLAALTAQPRPFALQPFIHHPPHLRQRRPRAALRRIVRRVPMAG